jgi:16S rRNA (cytosine967-C5)-methyltransferase
MNAPAVSPARRIAWELLLRIERDRAYADRLLESTLRRHRLEERERALLTELLHGVLRWKRRLEFLLQRLLQNELRYYPLPLRVALAMGVYQLLFLERIPPYAVVHQMVELVKPLGTGAARLVNAVLRQALREYAGKELQPEALGADVATWYSYPDWIARRWCERFGCEETIALMQAQNQRPPTTLRVNPQRNSPEELLRWLIAKGATAGISPYCAQCIVAEQLLHEQLQEVLQRGWASVQDVSAVLIVQLADVQPGMRVIDLCAAPGGKSCALAERLGGEGVLEVVDVHPGRLRLVEQEARRLGVAAPMRFHVADARTVSLAPADCVLADVPCSGLGTIAKKPDIKWHRREEDISALVQLQWEILQNAARLVRPGGVLLYSTCTIEPEENEQQVERFLREHPEFTVEPATQWLPEVVCRDGMLQTLPHRHAHCDGAFAVRLRRQ